MWTILRTGALAAVLVTLPNAAEADCTNPFGHPDEILDLHVRTDEATWQLVEEGSVGSCDQRIYHEVEFRCGEEEPWLAIGARHKVASGGMLGKPHLKFDFNRFVPGQGWPATYGTRDLKKINLLNGGGDATIGDSPRALLSEFVGLRVLASEVLHSPAVAYARVWLHLGDEPATNLGLYIVVEQVDRPFLRRRFGTDEGRLFKLSGQPCDGVRFDDGVGQELDVAHEELYRQVAIRDILGDQDTMWDKDRNYYRFEASMDGGVDATIPWDFDDAFSRIDSDATVPVPEDEPLHLSMLCEMINGTLSESRLTQLVEDTHALIEADVQGETDYAAYVERLDHLLDEYIPTRIPLIRQQLTDAGYECPLGCTDGEARMCEFGPGCPGERACADGLWTTCVPTDSGCIAYPETMIPDPGTDGGLDSSGDDSGDGSGDGSVDVGGDANGDGSGAGPGTGAGTGAGTSAGGTGEDGGAGSGCGCTTGSGTPALWWMFMGLAALWRRPTGRPIGAPPSRLTGRGGPPAA